MGSRLAFLFLSSVIVIGAACGPKPQQADDDGTGDDDAGDLTIDASRAPDAERIDGGNAYPDAEPYADGGSCSDWECANPVADGCDLGGPDVCGNGTDDNCNGEVDEGCPCEGGEVQQCFLGPPGRRGVGA